MTTTTMTQYLAGSREDFLCTAIRETAKAVGFSVGGSNRIAWFPKSQLKFVQDDFYTTPMNQYAIPGWLLNRKAAEIGVFPHYIGERS